MSQYTNIVSIHRLVWTALLAALTGAGALIAVPIGPLSPVPITLQTLFVLLAGLILGPRGGVTAMLLYMAAGAVGLPVFAGGRAGLAVFAGPTGGFLLSFVLMAWMAGLARVNAACDGGSFWAVLALCIVASLLNLVCGGFQLMIVLKTSAGTALGMVTPFLPGLLVKSVVAVTIYRFMAQRRLLPL